MESQRVNIEDYIQLYNTGLPLNKIKPLKNQTYSVFSKSKVKIRIVNRNSVYENPNAYTKIKHFVKDNNYFYMIPIETIKGTITGFILRGIFTNGYNTVSRVFSDEVNQVPLMFGFDKNFKKLDQKTECVPLIICEGCKDCITLKTIYPYVLSNNTSSMGINSSILRNITNKFLLAYDNDKAGKEGMEKDKQFLRATGAYVDSIKLPEGIKDCTDYLFNEYGMFNKNNYELFKKQLKIKLKQLYELN